MKRLLLLFVIFCSSHSTDAASRTTIEGKSAKETEIRWVWKYLGEVVLSCASSPTDCQDPQVKAVVQKLTGYLPLWKKADTWQPLLQFVSEKTNPHLFRSSNGETHRIAVTATQVGSPIYINSDRMNLPLSQWVGILAHEATHHLGFEDDQQRLPDVVGSAIASHFDNRSHISGLEEFGVPGSRMIVFNTLAPGRTAAGFFLVTTTSPKLPFALSDLELGSTSIQTFCRADEEYRGQETDAPYFNVTRIQFPQGIVSLRGTSNTLVTCVSRSTHKSTVRNYTFIAKVDVHFGTPLDPLQPWWNLTGSIDPVTVGVGHDDSKGYAMLASRSYIFVSTETLTPNLNPGGLWKTRTVLKSVDGFIPTRCGAFYSGANWAFQQKMDMPNYESFRSCQLTRLGGNQWQVDAEVTLPAELQPDSFFIPLIMLQDSVGPRMVVPKKFTYMRLENPLAAPAMKAVAWQIQGLTKQETYQGIKLTHGYSAEMGKPFFVDFEFAGPQSLVSGTIELQYLVNYSGQVVTAAQTLDSENPREALLRTETIQTPRGTVFRFVMQLPPSGLAFEVSGLHIVRAQVNTSDHAWPQADLPADVFIFGPSLK